MRNDSKPTLPLAIAFVLLWNSGFIGAEYGLPYAPPFTLLFWRYLALTLLLAAFLWQRGRSFRVETRLAALTAVIGILAHGVWLSCALIAIEQEVPAGVVALVVALQPAATGVLSGVVTGEGVNRRQWAGLLIGFGGVALAVVSRLNGAEGSLFGYLIPFGSVIAITFASLLERRQDRTGEPLPLDVKLFYQSLATTVFLAAPAIAMDGLQTDWELPFVATLIWLTVPVSLGAYALMWILIARTDATRVASLFYFGPPVTMAMAWLAFGDQLRITDLVGLAIVAAGVALVHISPKSARD